MFEIFMRNIGGEVFEMKTLRIGEIENKFSFPKEIEDG